MKKAEKSCKEKTLGQRSLRDKKLKIAFYNWASLHSSFNEGGGVSVYLKNISESLAEMGHEISILSSGFIYDITSRNVFVRKVKNKNSFGISYYDVVNSRVLASSYLMFPRIKAVLDEAETCAAVEKFLLKNGPFDVFHIQNVEGIPFSVLSLREKFKNTRFILSNHNYHAICQQVNLWKQDKLRCVDFDNGAACYSCNNFQPNYDNVLASRVACSILGKYPTGWVKKISYAAALMAVKARRKWRQDFNMPTAYQIDGENLPPATKFVQRREQAVELINKHCDVVISVSQAVEEILLSAGVDQKISKVNYIGTRHFKDEIKGRVWDGASPLRLGFLGYTRPDKGFQFLVDALESLPDELNGRLELLFAGKITDVGAMDRLKALSNKLSKLTIIDGYTQKDIEGIMSKVDLGIVPPLWDDALPQVAIEFICHGVPILVSDTGGQKEIAVDENFIFTSGDDEIFLEKLEKIVKNPSLTSKFWKSERPIKNMKTHVGELVSIYSQT